MLGKTMKSRIAILTAAVALTFGLAGTATAADADSVAAQGQKCSTVVTSNGAGKVDVCWNWYPNSSGKYNGRFWGTFHDLNKNDGRWVVLQAIWSGQGWTPVATAKNGEKFSRDYTNLKGLTFRACLTGGGGYCGPSPS
ncbi:hypothetical protein AB0K71_07230 [Streptomyces syringium]|uniref:hypothetical protein n=1 Tax=Streptomyces syringium TaxID=76729 RepID=UPI0033A478AE